jgi:hypothetical protein
MGEHVTLPFWFRQFISWSLKSAGIESLPERATRWPDHFDNTKGIGEVQRTLFYKDKRTGLMLPFKGRGRPVDVSTKIGVEAHITAISFGTTKRARQFWLRAIEDGLIPEVLLQKYQQKALEREGGPGESLELVAERMALHQRFWKVPYHYIALLNGDILYNNQITRYTYHGNGGNGPLVGISLEGNFPGLARSRKKKHDVIDDFVIETSRAAIRLSVNKSRDEGAPIEILAAHRQYSSGRLGDPGEEWWKEVGIPMKKELNLEVRYSFRHGSGNKICKDWDENGLVDYRGRSI